MNVRGRQWARDTPSVRTRRIGHGKWEAFDRILASLHEAALDPALWLPASALTDEALGTHGNTLVCGDRRSRGDIRIYFARTCLRGERHPDLERLYFETYYPLNERIPRLLRYPFNPDRVKTA